MNPFLPETYSYANCYAYPDKSACTSLLDWLSAPCRWAWGGKDVCILSNTSSRSLSHAGRVAAAISLCVAFPIGLISSLAFWLKILTSWRSAEKVSVAKQSAETHQLTNKFYVFFGKGSDEEALAVLSGHEKLENRKDIQKTLLAIHISKIEQILKEFLQSAEEDTLLESATKIVLAHDQIESLRKQWIIHAKGNAAKIDAAQQKEAMMRRGYSKQHCLLSLFEESYFQPIESLIKNIRTITPLCEDLRSCLHNFEDNTLSSLETSQRLYQAIENSQLRITHTSDPQEEEIMKSASASLDLVLVYLAGDTSQSLGFEQIIASRESYKENLNKTAAHLKKNHACNRLQELVIFKKHDLKEVVEGICTTLLLKKIELLDSTGLFK